MKLQRPIILLILDGWGIGEDDAHNAIFLAHTPNIDDILKRYPNGPIGAAGEHIGLDHGHQGSTEMGHLIISAGRNVLLPQMQIRQALVTGSIQQNAAYRRAFEIAKARNTRVHLMGLLSNAGVHSYDELCHVLLAMAARHGLTKEQVLIHVFADGRDTPPTSLPDHLRRLERVIEETGVGTIASLMGRQWIMDRDHRWERVEQAYNLLVHGRAHRTARSIEEAIDLAYNNKETDEFIAPTLIHPDGMFHDGDAVINYNYRVDREMEISQALLEPHFVHWDRGTPPSIHYVATLPYYDNIPAPTAFEREELKMKNILPEVVSRHGLRQYRLTETEKSVYVTKIFNAMAEEPFPGEEHHVIESDKIATFDLKPEMKAMEISQHCVEQLRKKEYDFFVLNICNADMVGHTGNKEATIKGCEEIDRAIGLLMEEVKKQHAIMVITADHGDAEVMWDTNNDMPHTQHTDNFVPFILVDDERTSVRIHETGSLKDVAPTILELMGIEKPADMNGKSLLLQ